MDSSDSSKKRRKFQLKLKKLHKSFRKSRPSNPAEAAITGAGSVSSPSETGSQLNCNIIFKDFQWREGCDGSEVVNPPPFT